MRDIVPETNKLYVEEMDTKNSLKSCVHSPLLSDISKDVSVSSKHPIKYSAHISRFIAQATNRGLLQKKKRKEKKRREEKRNKRIQKGKEEEIGRT